MKHTIPFFSLERQWNSIKTNLLPKIEELFESNQFVGGPYVENFEKHLKEFTGSLHAISCNSGTDALWLALKALEIKPNSIVLTTPFSFIASCSEIAAHRAQPVFIDVDESYNICPKKIELWLKSNAIMHNNSAFHKLTHAPIEGIIIVDLFGQCVNYKEIERIAKEWNLWIIEDACQAIGAHIDSKKTGTFGNISCFSFYPTKNLGVCGDGGAMTTNNPELAEKLLRFRNHGRKSHYNYESNGINSRLDAIQALIATVKLPLLDSWNKRRREIAHRYSNRLSKISFIKTPQEFIGYHVYHQYCIEITTEPLLGHRDMLKNYLTEHQIGTNIFYPKALNEISFLVPPAEYQTDCPRAERLTHNILALPVWPELTDSEVDYICSTIRFFL